MTEQRPSELAMELASLYRSLRPGEGVIIKFGTRASQYAHVVQPGRLFQRVRVWRQGSKTWTKPKPIRANEIRRMATDADLKNYAPRFGVEWDR